LGIKSYKSYSSTIDHQGELERVFLINMLKGDGREFIFYVEKG
jgi:hypothetical protein